MCAVYFASNRKYKVFERKAIRSLGVEGVRSLAQPRLVNLTHACSRYLRYLFVAQHGANGARDKAHYERRVAGTLRAVSPRYDMI